MTDLNENYWAQRYNNNDTSWDLGAPSSPLKAYFDQLTDKSVAILIPGAGNGYEAEYLFNIGFTNITLIDIAAQPLNNIKTRLPGFPHNKLILGDFFDHEGKYELIIEQTFFCALHPSRRADYVKKMHDLLHPGGKLVGVLFNDVLNADKPPFGGNKEEYSTLFQDHFQLKTLENCYNSIAPRANRELFIHFIRKQA
ncbi:MAG TPA: methyltransferase domain-containing protein [Bacteroidia bacterium]|jgi:thiopurine S-methyltransferase